MESRLLSLVSKSYQRILPFSFRARLWRWRRLPSQSGDISRHAKLRLTGHCNVCGSKKLRKFENDSTIQLPFRFTQCRDCEFIFALAPPDSATVYETFEINDLGEEVWNDHYLANINRRASGGGKLLEIGFGNGSFLSRARQSGWTTYGIDLSVPHVRNATEKLHLPNITLGTLEETAYPNEFFEVVAGFNFLEHVPDPRKTLQEIYRILKPGGLLTVMCPNIAGIFHTLMPELLGDNDPLRISWIPPEHLSYFNKANLRLLLESVGFTEVEDASEGMSSLWLQFGPQIGPNITDSKLDELTTEIQSSTEPRGEPRVAMYKQRIRTLLAQRMTWKMLADLMKLEPALGSEVGILYLAAKPMSK
jgi:ubiquinone/menaquinone biosynthesis C-methylase UbiE